MSETGKAIILVADDTRASLRFLVETLAGQGYTVRLARDGRTAIASARADPPDLILLDCVLPPRGGLASSIRPTFRS